VPQVLADLFVKKKLPLTPAAVLKPASPSQYLLQLRVEAARRQLERPGGSLKAVASAAGFGNVDVMRRAFVRLIGVTPRRYRELRA